MKKVKTLTILVGNIGSGKTTWAMRNRKKNEVVISRDNLRYMFGGGSYLYSLKTEPLVWDIELGMVDRVMMGGFSLIVDEVGVSREMRRRYINLAELFDYKVKVVEMPRLSMKDCVDRRMINSHGNLDRKVWEGVWLKFDKLYEKPCKKEERIDRVIRVKDYFLI